MSLCEAANGPTAIALILSDPLLTIASKKSGIGLPGRLQLDRYPVEGSDGQLKRIYIKPRS